MVVPWRGGAVVCMLILYGVRDTGVEIIQKYANNSHNNIGYRNSAHTANIQYMVCFYDT